MRFATTKLTSAGVAASLCLCPLSRADLVGGMLVTLPEWNDAASTTLGEPTQVFRLFIAFENPTDELNQVYLGYETTFLATMSGTFHFDPMNPTLIPPAPAHFEFAPELEWSTYFGLGNLHAPAETLNCLPLEGVTDTVIDDTCWSCSNSSDEGIARAPGSTDANGEVVIPESLDPRFSYVFAGQFVVHESNLDPVVRLIPARDRIWSDAFAGILFLQFRENNDINPQSASIQFAPIGCPGDMNGDDVVNGADLATVIAVWGEDVGSLTPNSSPIGGDDLARLLANWGPCLPQ